MHVFVWMNVGCPATSHMWKSEDNLGCYRSLLSTLFETGSLLFTVAYVNICKICCRPKTFWGYYCLHFPSPYSNSEITEAGYHTQLSLSSRDLNSDLHACVEVFFPLRYLPGPSDFKLEWNTKIKIAQAMNSPQQIQSHYFKNAICNKLQKSQIIKLVCLCHRLASKNYFVLLKK